MLLYMFEIPACHLS